MKNPFKFLKKGDDAPPDVGQEEVFEEKNDGGKKTKKEADDGIDEPVVEQETTSITKNQQSSNMGQSEVVKSFELERINAKLSAFDELLKGYSERFSTISERMGEIRNMSLENEREIAKVEGESAKAVDIVKEVKPEKLRMDYQRFDARLTATDEKIEATKQFMETIMNELKDLRTKAGIFVGTEALLKLNEDVKKDLIEIQKTSAKVRVNADKSEAIFIELRSGFAENQKMNQMVANLDNSYASTASEIGKLKVDYSAIVKQNELADIKKEFNSRLLAAENTFSKIEGVKEENQKLGQTIETLLAISKNNEEEISDIAMTIGNDKIKKVSDYDNKLDSILKIIDSLAGEVGDLKKVTGISSKKEKVKVKNDNKSRITKEAVSMDNMDISSKLSKPLIPENKEFQSQPAKGNSLSLKLGRRTKHRSKLQGIAPNLSNKETGKGVTKESKKKASIKSKKIIIKKIKSKKPVELKNKKITKIKKVKVIKKKIIKKKKR